MRRHRVQRPERHNALYERQRGRVAGVQNHGRYFRECMFSLHDRLFIMEAFMVCGKESISAEVDASYNTVIFRATAGKRFRKTLRKLLKRSTQWRRAIA